MNTIKKDIDSTIMRILEDWALMMVEPSTKQGMQIFDPSKPFYVSYLKFRGPINGQYSVVCQEAFANVLASNLLGCDGVDDEAARQDALKEFANVLSGNLLTSSWGEEAVFDLTSPQLKEVNAEEAKKLMDRDPFCFNADETPVAVTFTLSED